MSEEDFLDRWSRRKRAAKREGLPAGTSQPEATGDVGPSDDLADHPGSEQVLAGDQVPVGAKPIAGAESSGGEVDLSSLPPIESITAATDITAFLREGVPLELSRAALRRAWSADPAIRDFVGLAENAWDFNDPNAMPGFGPLDCSDEQLRELVAKVIGDTQRAVADLAGDAAPQDRGSPSPDLEIGPAPELSSSSAPPAVAMQDDGDASDAEPATPDAAAQSAARSEAVAQPARISGRVHGGALPR
jgi:hypothetical protein